jgi:hypothetical protein
MTLRSRVRRLTVVDCATLDASPCLPGRSLPAAATA